MPLTDLAPGDVAWVDFGGGDGREQSGRRPAVVLSSPAHLHAATELVTVLPCTARDRGWGNHIALSGDLQLEQPTFAMTEQPRTISRSRVHGTAGQVSPACLTLMREWVARWLDIY